MQNQSTKIQQLATQYAVVSPRLALALQGSKHWGNTKGTMYATFSSMEAALAYQQQRKLTLCSKIVTL